MISIIGLPDDLEKLQALFALVVKDGYKETIALLSQKMLEVTNWDVSVLEE
jgi:hypothetical protein